MYLDEWDDRQDRLAILSIGACRLGLPLSEVAYFAQISQRQAIQDGPPWMSGVVADRDNPGAFLPVVNLSLLWHDAALGGHATTLVVTRSGLALEVDSYSATREPLYLTPLRPAPGNHALRYASLLEGQPLPIVDTAQLITTAQWQSLAATA